MVAGQNETKFGSNEKFDESGTEKTHCKKKQTLGSLFRHWSQNINIHFYWSISNASDVTWYFEVWTSVARDQCENERIV